MRVSPEVRSPKRRMYACHMPLSHEVCGRRLGCILAGQYYDHGAVFRYSARQFAVAADKERRALAKEAPGSDWRAVSRSLENLHERTGRSSFSYWEILTFCPRQPCGKLQSLNGEADVGLSCRFCGADLYQVMT
jgi:hypothetical protein